MKRITWMNQNDNDSNSSYCSSESSDSDSANDRGEAWLLARKKNSIDNDNRPWWEESLTERQQAKRQAERRRKEFKQRRVGGKRGQNENNRWNEDMSEEMSEVSCMNDAALDDIESIDSFGAGDVHYITDI